jgi:prepilin-type processing-associated H-X9-DG protein/prepilin-type N-terminal cleavage/methylation domain-containing protein
MNKNRLKTTFSIAFTLVELLVVITIIGLLAGLAVPAVNRGLKSAKGGACLSNLHQIGVATMAYAADNSFKLPNAGSGTSDMWATKLATFMSTGTKSKKSIFVCPGSEKTVQEATGNDVAVTYGVHSGLMPKGGTACNISSVVRVAEVILAGDVCQETGNKGWSPFCIEQPSAFPEGGGSDFAIGEDLSTPLDVGPDEDGPKSASLRYRHNGKVNVVMVDGHAESIEKGSVLMKHAKFGQ